MVLWSQIYAHVIGSLVVEEPQATRNGLATFSRVCIKIEPSSWGMGEIFD